MSTPWLTAQIALDTKLQAYRPALPVAWQGVASTKDIYESHLRVANLPAGSDMATLGVDGQARTRGIYQVSVFVPAGKGVGEGLRIASDVADHFSRQRLTEAGVEVQCEVPSQGPVIPEADWLHVPVSIPYYLTVPA